MPRSLSPDNSERIPDSVLIATSYFRPDHAGIAVYATDFADYLGERGVRTTVITTFPFYPGWKKRSEDRGRLFADTSERGHRVLRGFAYVPQQPSTFRRIIHELSVSATALINALRAGRHEAVVVFSPPFLLCMVGWLVARLTRARFVINVQDLPSAAAAALGMVRGALLFRVAATLEGFLYRRADQVVSISHSMLEAVARMGVSESNLRLVPNWIDVSKHEASVVRHRFRSRHGISPDAFLISYAGNVGVKQGLDQLVELAAALDEDSSIELVLAGDGADKARLVDLASKRGANRLRFLPFLPPDEYRELLQDSDIIFVAQKSGSGDNFFPSKLLGIMAQARPLLVCADANSELAQVVTEADCAIAVPYGNRAALIDAVRSLQGSPERLGSLGRNGRRFVSRFDRDLVLSTWLTSLT